MMHQLASLKVSLLKVTATPCHETGRSPQERFQQLLTFVRQVFFSSVFWAERSKLFFFASLLQLKKPLQIFTAASTLSFLSQISKVSITFLDFLRLFFKNDFASKMKTFGLGLANLIGLMQISRKSLVWFLRKQNEIKMTGFWSNPKVKLGYRLTNKNVNFWIFQQVDARFFWWKNIKNGTYSQRLKVFVGWGYQWCHKLP